MPEARIYYWRTTTGYEVDFVIERGRDLLAVEVKSATAPRFSDIKGLQLFLTRRYQINQKGRDLLVAVSPKLKDRIIDEFAKSESTAKMVFKLHPEYLSFLRRRPRLNF